MSELALTKVDPLDAENALSSMLPQFTPAKKSEYLFWRALYFNRQECLQLAKVSSGELREWLRSDREFRLWYKEKILDVQRFVGPKLVKLQFIRNMGLSMKIDYDLLKRVALEGSGGLSKSEDNWARDAAGRYKSSDLVAMMKALEENEEDGQTKARSGEVNVTFVLDGRSALSEEEKREGFRQLLQRFEMKSEVIEGDFSYAP